MLAQPGLKVDQPPSMRGGQIAPAPPTMEWELGRSSSTGRDAVSHHRRHCRRPFDLHPRAGRTRRKRPSGLGYSCSSGGSRHVRWTSCASLDSRLTCRPPVATDKAESWTPAWWARLSVGKSCGAECFAFHALSCYLWSTAERTPPATAACLTGLTGLGSGGKDGMLALGGQICHLSQMGSSSLGSSCNQRRLAL